MLGPEQAPETPRNASFSLTTEYPEPGQVQILLEHPQGRGCEEGALLDLVVALDESVEVGASETIEFGDVALLDELAGEMVVAQKQAGSVRTSRPRRRQWTRAPRARCRSVSACHPTTPIHSTPPPSFRSPCLRWLRALGRMSTLPSTICWVSGYGRCSAGNSGPGHTAPHGTDGTTKDVGWLPARMCTGYGQATRDTHGCCC